MLRESSALEGEPAAITALANPGHDSRVPHGPTLIAFAEAIVTGAQALEAARTAVVEAIGPAATVDAAGVASNFERMVRIAGSTGIELGDRLERGSADARAALGLTRPSAPTRH